MHGTAIAKNIREKNDQNTVVFSISGDDDQQSREKFLLSGMDDFLPKPFVKRSLTELLSKYFEFYDTSTAESTT